MDHRNFLFPVEIAPNTTMDVILKVETSGSMQLPLAIWHPGTYLFEDQTDIIRKSLFYGALAVMVLYNLFLFLSLKEPAYIYYVLFVSAFLITQAAMHGILYQYLWSSSPRTHELSILLGVPSNVLFTSLFAVSFLSLKKHAKRAYYFFITTAILAGLSVFAGFFLSYGISTRLSVALVVPVCAACLIVGPMLWLKGHKIARFYTLAWAFMVVGSSMLALNKFGIIPSNIFTENGLQLGATLEAIFLSFALADRLNEERAQRENAQQSLLNEMEYRQESEKKRIYDATHNYLTKFPNKAFLENRTNALLKCAENDQVYSLVFFHLTRFHEINKTLGHRSADQLLVVLTEKLNEHISNLPGIVPIEERENQSAYISVIGGVAIAYLVESTLTRHEDDVRAIIDKFESIEFNSLSIELNVKGGIAQYPEHGIDAKTLIRNAQIAVDIAEQSKSKVIYYKDNINPYSEKRLTLIGDLRQALKQDKLNLHFQPQICFKENKVTGVEALIRWVHEEHGFIPPDEFIPLAEQTGLITEVTTWVLDKSVEALAELQNNGFDLTMSINISALNLREKGFAEKVQKTVTKYGISPEKLVLEVTETATMDDPEQALNALERLNLTGVKLSIDDFGTGYSSLNYIKRLPVNEIKIDRSFIMDMDKDGDDIVIVQTTINMCHNLGYSVVAEGVESVGILNQLADMGCDFAQGYYLSKPIEFKQLLIWLKEDRIHIS